MSAYSHHKQTTVHLTGIVTPQISKNYFWKIKFLKREKSCVKESLCLKKKNKSSLHLARIDINVKWGLTTPVLITVVVASLFCTEMRSCESTGCPPAGIGALWPWSSPPGRTGCTQRWASRRGPSSSNGASFRAASRGSPGDRACDSRAPPAPAPHGSPSLQTTTPTGFRGCRKTGGTSSLGPL